jgi:hypothetical protein
MANDTKETLTEQWLQSLKNKRVIAFVLVLSAAIIGISAVSQHVIALYRLVIPMNDDYERVFSRSIEKLESADADSRIEAIGALKRLGAASEEYRVKVLEALGCFVRKQAPWRPDIVRNAVEKDVELALKTIAQLPKSDSRGSHYRVDMHNVDISGATLENADLEGAIIWGSNLRNVILSRANLRAADLGGTDFTGASLEMADLQGAFLWYSFDTPNRPCIFNRTRLAGANLRGARLDGAILVEAIDLTRAQVDQAIVNENTRLPRGITVPNKAPSRPP